MGGFFAGSLDYFRQGGAVMAPLLLSLVALWYALGYRNAALRRPRHLSLRELVRRGRNGSLEHSDALIVRAVHDALRFADSRKGRLDRRFFLDLFTPMREEAGRHRLLVSVIVRTAPLMGLLGTVIGMIETFDALGDMSLFTQSGGIAGGISQALITTQLGLAVAIPGLLIGRNLDKKQADLENELDQLADLLCGQG
ncbi:MAG: MotA/TolQ/ExbB proton channel family protein [Deltaproteobacteria bacterium]|nr:MotA/TolQ/ExbB proton channel family protein [Deltaproteobacteria bacterium]MCB9488718.1 MotA/TolQ/ExbB proton channel family protein [Deltaproteobacteria bacterium]